MRFPTYGDVNSPKNCSKNFDQVSDKFMTPLEQSSIFHTIQGEKSFDFNSLNLVSSRFKRSQTLEQSVDFIKDRVKQENDSTTKRNSA